MLFLFLMDASDSWRTFDESNGPLDWARDVHWTPDVDLLKDQLHCPAESTANASSNDKDSPTATPLCDATNRSRWCSGSLEELWDTKCAVDEAFLAEPVEQCSAELVGLYCLLGHRQLPMSS